MSNPTSPAEGELSVRPPERPKAPTPEVKRQEGPLGVNEQSIINRIDKDGDPDRVLQDISQTPDQAPRNPNQGYNNGMQENRAAIPQPNEARVENAQPSWEQMLGGQLGNEFRDAARGRTENNRYHNGYTMREFARAHPREAAQLLGSYKAQFGEVHPQLLQAIHDVDELKRNPVTVPTEDPKYAGLAYNLENDPNYKAIAEQLDKQHKRAVFGTDDPEAIKQIPLERFMDLVNTDQNLLWSGQRDVRAQQLFRQQFPDQDQLYRQREVTRVYRDPDGVINPQLDPAFPTGLVAMDENLKLREFAQRYPDKAKAYAQINPKLKPFITPENVASNGATPSPEVAQPTKLPEAANGFDWSQVEVAEGGPPIVGGEIITPTAIRIGETSGRAAMERGWLSGITSAFGKTDLPVEQRRANVQEVVNAAKAAGIPRETIAAHLQSLGINAVDATSLQRPETAQSQQATPEGPITEYDTKGNPVDKLKTNENLLDEEKAAKIIGITKDWVKYGGNFYDHLTGKRIHLQKGVDYKVNPDGTPDMTSYREARHRLVQAWLQQPGNQKWLADGNNFPRDHKAEISPGMEKVQVRQPDGTLSDKDRYTQPYFYDNGWLYYETNHFDKQKREMTQPDRESTKYRVYLSPDGGDVMGSFQEVLTLLNQNPELQKYGFQAKTADVANLSEGDLEQIMNQKDRIVLYLGEEGMKAALPALQQYAEAQRQKFSKEGVLLGQPLLDSQGNAIPGVVITSEPKGYSPDPDEIDKKYASFSDMQAKIIDSSFRFLRKALQDPSNMQELSKKLPALAQRLQALGTKPDTRQYIEAMLADSEGEAFLQKNLQAIYPQWAQAFGMSPQNIAFKAA